MIDPLQQTVSNQMSSEQSGSPPFCFLIPLQSAQVSKNWKRVSRLFEMCLASIFQQTSGNFLVLVGCHEIPEVRFANDPRLRFFPMDFPPPQRDSTSTEERMRDKWDKMLRLTLEAGRVDPSHLMIVDADDLVNHDLVEYAQSRPESHGWLIDHGYCYSVGSRFILEQCGSFNCGTNSILNARRIQFPQSATHEERMKCLALTAGHTTIAGAMADQGTPLDRLSFPGAIYMINHGDNDSHLGDRRSWKHWLMRSRWLQTKRMAAQGRWHWLSRSIRQEFALPTRVEMKAIVEME